MISACAHAHTNIHVLAECIQFSQGYCVASRIYFYNILLFVKTPKNIS